jgi:hypothetical protein
MNREWPKSHNDGARRVEGRECFLLDEVCCFRRIERVGQRSAERREGAESPTCPRNPIAVQRIAVRFAGRRADSRGG